MATAGEKRLTLAAAVLGTSVVFLDATVTSVALPAIRGDLGGGLAGQQWVTNAYLLALVSLLLIGGSLGDVFGQKRVFLAGVAGFGLTSALCAIASSIPELCVFRSMQGVCAALVTPTALAVIIHVFPEDERARAIGTWTALSSTTATIPEVVHVRPNRDGIPAPTFGTPRSACQHRSRRRPGGRPTSKDVERSSAPAHGVEPAFRAFEALRCTPAEYCGGS
jgi:Major Facilitator Superfamily